jgi:hypothetical protein
MKSARKFFQSASAEPLSVARKMRALHGEDKEVWRYGRCNARDGGKALASENHLHWSQPLQASRKPAT